MRNALLLLKSASRLQNSCQGLGLHADLVKSGLLDQNIYVGVSLLNMYAKCGLLEEAQEVFDRLPVQNVVAWTSLIEGYAQHGHNGQALKCFESMQAEGICPDASAFVCTLKACGNVRDPEKGQEIHLQIIKHGVLQQPDKSIMLGTALVDMYIKCSMLMKAQAVFDELRVRDVVSWSVLIAGYANHGHGQKALDHFEQMQREGVLPDVVTYLSILKACGSIGSFHKGQEVHGEIIRAGFLLVGENRMIRTALVDMYGKCGALAKAQEVFDALQDRDKISWNVLIANYAEHGHIEEAQKSFNCMQSEGLPADVATFVSLLKVCTSIDKGKEVHANIVSQRLVRKDIMVGNALMDMYAKCGGISQAREIFDGLPVKDVTCWNTIITGCIQHGENEEASDHFNRLVHESLLPNVVTCSCILRSCSNSGEIEKGERIHARFRKAEPYDKDVLFRNELIHMYAKCGAPSAARKVFEEAGARDVISWTALISGCAQAKLVEEACGCLKQMQQEGQYPNEVTIICILKACGSTGAVEKGLEMHGHIGREPAWKQNTRVCNALADMYSKCNMLTKARAVFEGLHLRDIVSWTTLVSGYAQRGYSEEAAECFRRLHCEAVMPNIVTLVCMLRAAGSMGLIRRGREVHVHAKILGGRSRGEDELLVGNALVDMYVKCGDVEEARAEFDELRCRSVVSWTALIGGYDEAAIDLFNEMIGEGIEPNVVTFGVVLNACSHSGLLDMGQSCFEAMIKSYGISPTPEHYTTMVDLFSRLGLFENAVALLERMPSPDSRPMWAALLSSCQRWGNTKLGELAYNHAVQLDEMDAAPYVCMRNMYA